MCSWWLWWQTVWGLPFSLYILLEYRSDQWIPLWCSVMLLCVLLATLTTRYERSHSIPLWVVFCVTCVLMPAWWYLCIYVWNNDLWYVGTILLGACLASLVSEKKAYYHERRGGQDDTFIW